MKQKAKIAVIGIGGVGGYVAAMLGKTYPNTTLVARGERKKAIMENGLILHSECQGKDISVDTTQVVEKVSELPEQDYIFICVKHFSLAEVCQDLRSVVTDNTIIMPIMNGVDPGDRVRELIGKGTVLDALAYIISYADQDYSIVQKGDYAKFRIGTMSAKERELLAVNEVLELMKGAQIDCRAMDDIQSAIWEKYILNCAFNVLTAYYSSDVKGLRQDEKRIDDYKAILKEGICVAAAKGVHLPEGLYEKLVNHFMHVQSDEGTSSLRRDMDAGKDNEKEAFGGYLVREARRLGIAVPVSEWYYSRM